MEQQRDPTLDALDFDNITSREEFMVTKMMTQIMISLENWT